MQKPIGTIDACCVEDAKTRQSKSQTSLHSFDEEQGEERYVGVVRNTKPYLNEVVESNDKRLAPSDDLFSDFCEKKKYLTRSEGLDEREAHNRAFQLVRYKRRFIEEVDEDVLEEYAQKARWGERIVFVCYCGTGKMCHRRIVKELLHERL